MMTPASSMTAISLNDSNVHLNEVYGRMPVVVQNLDRSSSVRPEKMWNRESGKGELGDEKENIRSPEPEYEMLEITPEEIDFLEKVSGYVLVLAITNVV